MNILNELTVPIVSNSENNNEVITIPNEFTIYQQTYIDSNDQLKNKINRFERFDNSTNFPKNAIIITHQTLFILDITGSMQSIIDSVKNEIVPVMRRLKEVATNAVNELKNDGNIFVLNFEVSIIGYRDFCDKIHFETHDFTSDIYNIEEFLNSLKASGGGDEPEDVKGAFIHALYGVSDRCQKLSWKSETASKAIFLITDAPPHGIKFHGTLLNDNLINCNENEWHLILKEMKLKQISFNIIKINTKTTTMSNEFNRLCKIHDLSYTEIDISQQIQEKTTAKEHYDFDFGEYSHGTNISLCGGRDISTLEGRAEEHLSSIYRMTSMGYATSSRTSYSKKDEEIVLNEIDIDNNLNAINNIFSNIDV